MEQNLKGQKSDPKAIRERFQRKAYRMMIEVGFIFGIPAFLAYQGGKALERKYETGGAALLAALVGAFLFSWAVVVVKYRQMQKEARAFDAAYREMQKQRTRPSVQGDNEGGR